MGRDYEPRAFNFLSFPGTRSDLIGSFSSLIALDSGHDSQMCFARMSHRNGTERRGALRFFPFFRARDSREVRAESDGGRLNVMCLFLRRRYSHGQPPRTLACTHARTHVRTSSLCTYIYDASRARLLTKLTDIRHNLHEITEIDPFPSK